MCAGRSIFFVRKNRNSDIYLNLLRNSVVPALAALFPNANNNYQPNGNIWFQQDPAPLHFAIDVRNYFNEIFSAGWTGRRGVIERIHQIYRQ